MRRSVFYSAELETTASFAYVLTMHAMKQINKSHSEAPSGAHYNKIRRLIRYDRFHELPDALSVILSTVAPPKSSKSKKTEPDRSTNKTST